MIGHYKHIVLIEIHDNDALDQQEKVILSPLSFKSKFIRQKRQIWILVIISFLSVIGHYKHVFFIGIHYIDALFLCWKHCFLYFPIYFPPFLRIKVHLSIGITQIHVIISFVLMTAYHKHILLIGINDIDALVP